MKDERIILSKRKIQSDGFMIVWFVLLVSTLIQQSLGASVSQYIVETVIWLSMSIYMLVLNFAKGNDVYPTNHNKSNSLILIQSLFTGLVIAIINTTQNYLKYSEAAQDAIVMHVVSVAVISFISATIAVFVVLKALAYFNSKNQQKINDKLDDEE